LVQIIEEYGEDGRAKRIARYIIERRKKGPIASAKELSNIILKAKGKKGRIHPATKTFQAIRIEVNQELKNLEIGIKDGIEMLSPGGRIGVISFHSLEDRVAKNLFKGSPDLRALTKRPVRAEMAEIQRNPGARSAKLRVVEKVQGGQYENKKA
jgi:16S rRNA (cytosine1402-N4)-methyltransferase